MEHFVRSVADRVSGPSGEEAAESADQVVGLGGAASLSALFAAPAGWLRGLFAARSAVAPPVGRVGEIKSEILAAAG